MSGPRAREKIATGPRLTRRRWDNETIVASDVYVYIYIHMTARRIQVKSLAESGTRFGIRVEMNLWPRDSICTYIYICVVRCENRTFATAILYDILNHYSGDSFINYTYLYNNM